MKRKYRVFLPFALAMLYFFSTPNARADKSPMDLLKETQNKIQEILKQETKKDDTSAKKKQSEQIGEILKPFFDFQHLAKKALGKHWEQRSATEKAHYEFWLQALLENAYLESLKAGAGSQDAKNVSIHYTKQTVEKTKATVFTVVEYPDPKTKKKRKVRIDWVFYKQSTHWKVGDMVTNDNSLAETYEEQFDKIIREKSFAELIQRIKNKVNQLRKEAHLAPLTGPQTTEK